MRIIAISGKAGHGKDTAAAILQTRLEADGYKVLIVHYGDLLKYICQNFFGWNGKKDCAGRRLLQYIGTDIVRKKRPDFWVDFVRDILCMFDSEWDYALIPDCRFPNEIQRLREAGFDVIHLRVVRPAFVGQLTPEQMAHPSETSLDSTVPDWRLENSGTICDLKKAIMDWLKEIK